MDRNIRKLCFVLMPAFLIASACSRSNDEGTRSRSRDSVATATATNGNRNNVAFVRFINARPESGLTNLFFGGRKVFSDVEYRNVSQFTEAPAERVDFALQDADKPGENLAIHSEELSGGKYYSIISLDDENGLPTLLVVGDEEGEPSSGKTKLRLLHAAPGISAIEVYASGRPEKIANESRCGNISRWNEIDPVDTPLEVRAGAEGNMVRIPNVSLDAGRLYTLIVSGGGKMNRKLDVIRIADSGRHTRT